MKPLYRFGEFIKPETEEERKKQEESRIRKFVISDNTRDRHGTILNVKKWDLKNYKKNPIVGYAHDIYGGLFDSANPDKIIGKGNVYLEGEKLIGEIEFEPVEINEFAEKILNKVDFGTLRSTSVGFYPKGTGKYGKDDEAEGEKDETYYYGGQELIEFSIVNIPSNPNAVKRADQEDQEIFLKNLLGELIDLNWEDIEKLTVKGIINIIKGIEKVERQPETENRNFNSELIKIQLENRIRLREMLIN